MVPYGNDRPLEYYGKPFVTNVKPSKNFIKRIEKDLPLDSNDISIALKLYNNLNEVVEYSEETIAFNQDLSIPFLKRIYNKTIDMINLTDNIVTCKSWSELYAYFLTKHNISCVINENVVHRSVYFKTEGLLFNADATSKNQDERDNYLMADLTRSKLGLRPNGLGAFFQDENGARKINIYDLGLNLAESTQIDYVDFEDRTNAIIENLGNCKTFKIHNIPDIQDRVTDTFSLINNLLLMEDLDNLSAIKYINTLLKVLFTKDENRRLTYIPVKEVDNKGNYSYSEIINYNPSLEKDNKREFDNRNLEGYNFICRSSGIEYLTPRKARKIIEKSRDIDTDILSK